MAQWYGGSATGQYISNAIGPVLYQSPVISGTQQLTQYVFNTGGLTLTEGDTYLLFILQTAGGPGSAEIGVTGNDGYPGGQFYLAEGGYPGNPTTITNWISPVDSNAETAFTAEFTAVTPLPAALSLFATGLGGLGLLGWRSKRKAQAAA